jgi:hypothetical protein
VDDQPDQGDHDVVFASVVVLVDMVVVLVLVDVKVLFL